MASIWGAAGAHAGVSAAAVWRTVVLGDRWAALLWSPVTLLVNLPLLTAIWVDLALQLGLDLVGRQLHGICAAPPWSRPSRAAAADTA